MPCILGDHSITCYRRKQKPFLTKLINKQNESFNSHISKEDFNKLGPDRIIDVFDTDNKPRKFLKEFLTLIEA